MLNIKHLFINANIIGYIQIKSHKRNKNFYFLFWRLILIDIYFNFINHEKNKMIIFLIFKVIIFTLI